MKNRIPLLFALCALGTALSLPSAHAGITDGLVSYWPLDVFTNDGSGLNVTPDLGPNTNNLSDNFTMTGADLVPGIHGNALSFDGTNKYVSKSYTVGDDNGLAIYNAGYYTISMWVKGVGATQPGAGRTVFSEASTLNNNALLQLRTDWNATASLRTNLFSALIADTGGTPFFGNQATIGDVAKSTGSIMPFDGSWHHIAWVDSNGTARVYVDGVLDPKIFNNTRLVEPANGVVGGLATLNTLALGAILRSAGGSSFFAGQIDDVAIWARTLTQAEINQVRTNAGVVLAGPFPPVAPAITNQPVGNTNLVAGDSWAIKAFGLGTHPFSYQWYSNNVALVDDGLNIAGSTNQILSLTNLPAGFTGNYTVVITNLYGSVTSSPTAVLVGTVTAQTPNLTNGQIAYWPLNDIQGGTTPDIVGGYDMFVNNVVANSIYTTNTGRFNNAVQFSGGVSSLVRIFSTGDALPLEQYSEFTIACWVNAAPQSPGGSGMRFFAMGNTASTAPWLSLANVDTTAQDTAHSSLGTMRAFFRNDNNVNNATAGVGVTQNPIYDNSWHHVTYVQRVVGGAIPLLQGLIFIDGTNDPMIVACSPRLPQTAQIIAIGGSVRNSSTTLGSGGTRAAMIGAMDDVAVWKRALTPLEIYMLTTNTVPPAPPTLPPLVINRFNADFAETVSGDSATLRWTVSGTPLALTLNGNSVLALTTNGIGSLVVSGITSTTNFSLVATRVTTSVTNTTGVTVVTGIGAGWHVLDDFQTYAVGALITPANPYWVDLNNGSSIVNVGGKNMLNANSGNGALGQVAVLPLNSLTVNQGQARTLFARIYIQDDPNITTMQHRFGFTEKAMKDARDTILDTGPVARIYTDSGPQLAIGAYNGYDGTNAPPLTLFPYKLEYQQVYNIWIDITNAPLTATNSGDIYSIWLQRLGTTDRILVLSNFNSDRDLLPDFLGGGTAPVSLNEFIVGNANSSGTVYLTDAYISASGYNSTVPVAWTGSAPPALAVPNFSMDTDMTTHPGQLLFTWDGGALLSAPTLFGPWTLVADSFGFTYLLTPDPATPQRFFRIQR